MENRFNYFTSKSRERCEQVLEDSFASGDIFPGERPEISPLRDHRGKVTGYALTLPTD